MAIPRFQWAPTFRVPSEVVVPAIFLHIDAKFAALVPPLVVSSGVSVSATVNIARFARGSLRLTRMPRLPSGPDRPKRCSLNIAVFDVPSVIDWNPTDALFE